MKHYIKISRIETCINDIQNFIQMYKDGVYDDDTEFLEDIEANAEAILDETRKQLIFYPALDTSRADVRY